MCKVAVCLNDHIYCQHFGQKRPIDESDKGKIALLRVSGAITDKSARKTIMSLRKIKKDKNVKCVVLRVDSPGGSSIASEAILQECNDLPQVSTFVLI